MDLDVVCEAYFYSWLVVTMKSGHCRIDCDQGKYYFVSQSGSSAPLTAGVAYTNVLDCRPE
jgi:hypothetical protein